MAKQLVVLLLLMLPFSTLRAEETSLKNQLANHPSPYLALHGSDPVAWQEWNADTVALAKRENKMLFVSIGYYACHWCHVMQRESYKNKEIAGLLNREFIPVKVDRELNTGLDEALQDFSAKLLQIGGWPLNAFVTPEGYPVYVVLYAPSKDFQTVLTRLSDRWKTDSGALKKLAQQAIAEEKQQIQKLAVNAAMQARWEKGFLQQAKTDMDELRGGFGEISKFPMAPQLTLMLELQAAKPDAKLGAFLRLTLDQMAARGLSDHVNGGFFRYTTDPGWETPHFEKMLYDNAQLARIYFRAARVFKEPHYQKVAFRAVDFILNDLSSPEGGFFASTSAIDEQGREGAYYLWDSAELKKHLDDAELAAVRRVWRLNSPAPFEFGYLPAEWVAATVPEQKLLQSASTKLRQVRKSQPPPKDDKRNAGLNGLALSALSDAMRVDTRYRQPAADIHRFIREQLISPEGLYKSVAKDKKLKGAELEDYAYVAQGMLDYADAAGDEQARKDALSLLRLAWQKFSGVHGWSREEEALLANVHPEAVLADGPVASPSSVLIMTTLRLGEAVLLAQAREALQWRSMAMARDPFSYATQILAYRLNLNFPPASQPAAAGAPPSR